jgi:hypothetical protein
VVALAPPGSVRCAHRHLRFEISQCPVTRSRQAEIMGTLLYRCPNTGLRVQAWVSDDRSENDPDRYDGVKCLACGQLHMVNPDTGKVLGAVNE